MEGLNIEYDRDVIAVSVGLAFALLALADVLRRRRKRARQNTSEPCASYQPIPPTPSLEARLHNAEAHEGD